MTPKILVVEISGKRPGDVKDRPTENFKIKYDHLIISNNSDGYLTDWKIVNVPEDYVEWYKAKHKASETAWYAPMNRSYAIKYARERGYDYLIQLDDNIQYVEIGYMIKGKDGITKRYRVHDKEYMINDFIEMLVCVLENTNAGMSGCALCGTSVPSEAFLRERYCYSLFALKLSVCPDVFHGDFEDDIEYRLKLAEKGIPAVMVCPLRYSKTGQKSAKDETGNRAAYTAAGLKRGEHMRKLHGDLYKCGYSDKTASVSSKADGKYFRHRLKTFKIGIMVKDMDVIKSKFKEILEKNAKPLQEKAIIKVKRKKA